MIKDILDKSLSATRRATLIDISHAFEDRSVLKNIAGKNVFIDTALYSIAKNNPRYMSMLEEFVCVDDLLQDYEKIRSNLELIERRRIKHEEECKEC